MIRVERTPTFRLANILDTPRGGLGNTATPIGVHPTPRGPLQVLQWPSGDIDKIIHSQWTPWPGYSVDPTKWSVIVESDGPTRDVAKAQPTDRPVLYMRGHPINNLRAEGIIMHGP